MNGTFNTRITVAITIEYFDDEGQTVPHVTKMKVQEVDGGIAIPLSYALRGLNGQVDPLWELLETADNFLCENTDAIETAEVYEVASELAEVHSAINTLLNNKRTRQIARRNANKVATP